MVWMTKRNAIVAAIGALSLFVIVWMLISVLKGPSPGAQDSAESSVAPPPASEAPKATNSLPLEGFYTMPASSFTADNTFAWPGLPRDLQIFSGVRFHVDGSAMLGEAPAFRNDTTFRTKGWAFRCIKSMRRSISSTLPSGRTRLGRRFMTWCCVTRTAPR